MRSSFFAGITTLTVGYRRGGIPFGLSLPSSIATPTAFCSRYSNDRFLDENALATWHARHLRFAATLGSVTSLIKLIESEYFASLRDIFCTIFRWHPTPQFQPLFSFGRGPKGPSELDFTLVQSGSGNVHHDR